MKLTFLGTGTSFGVPQVGCDCEVCRSTDPRDKRTRVGAFLESGGGTRLLIDTPPELRLQLLRSGIKRADAVLITHEHADHVNGLDDIRPLSLRGDVMPVYASTETLGRLGGRFPYVFDAALPLPGTSKPQAIPHAIRAGEAVRIGEVDVLPLEVNHGPVTVYGYRIGNLGYVTDAKSLPAKTVEALRGVKVMVLNALFPTSHPTHLSISEAVAAAREIGAERTYLTHLTHRVSHARLEQELPTSIAPAYDGLTVTID